MHLINTIPNITIQRLFTWIQTMDSIIQMILNWGYNDERPVYLFLCTFFKHQIQFILLYYSSKIFGWACDVSHIFVVGCGASFNLLLGLHARMYAREIVASVYNTYPPHLPVPYAYALLTPISYSQRLLSNEMLSMSPKKNLVVFLQSLFCMHCGCEYLSFLTQSMRIASDLLLLISPFWNCKLKERICLVELNKYTWNPGEFHFLMNDYLWMELYWPLMKFRL